MTKPILLMALDLEPEQKEAAEGRLRELADVRFYDRLSSAEFEDLVPRVEILVRYGFFKPFPDEQLVRMKRLRLIQVMAAGTQFLENDPAVPEGVAIRGARGANSASVAEQAMAHVLTLAKALPQQDRALRSGLFDQREVTRCLAESTMGILGLGSIGSEIASRALAFGMEVHAIDPIAKTNLPIASLRPPHALHEVLELCDVLVLSLPLTAETEGIIGAAELAAMKDDACLVNVGRGGLVDQRALYEHLVAHPRFKAGLDVWWKYPAFTSELIESHWGYPFDCPFHLLDNVTMTAHTAAYAGRARERMLRAVVESVIDFLGTR
jgi:phosphoglycerate dehydrogenase-like enzyme